MKRLQLIVGFCLVGFALGSAMAEVIVTPRLLTRGAYDDNPRLRSQAPVDVFVFVTEAEARTVYRRPSYDVTVTPKVRLSRYTKETELDSEDYFVNINGQKIFERHQFAGGFSFEEEATIRTEQDDSEVFNVNVDRTTLSLNGSWSYRISDRLSYTAFGNAIDVSFEEDPRTGFVDYLVFGLGSSLSYAFSERTTLIGTFSVSEFKVPEIGTETRSYSFQGGFQHEFDRSLSTTFYFGHNISHIDFKSSQTRLISLSPLRFDTFVVDQSERSAGEIIDLTVAKKFERSELKFEWSRSFSPSSQGARQRTEIVRGYARYRLTENLDADFAAVYRERTQEGQLNAQRLNNFKVVNTRGRLLYQFTPRWRGEVGYRYRRIDRLNRNEIVDAHRLFAAIRFTPEAYRFAN